MAGEIGNELPDTILTRISGPRDIASCGNCMTHLYLGVYDSLLVDPDIRMLEGVKGVILTSDQVQVIFGPGKVCRAAKVMSELLGEASIQDTTEIAIQSRRQLKARQTSGVQQFLVRFATIFTPLIPGFIAVGLLLGIAALIAMVIHVAADTRGMLLDTLNFTKMFSRDLFTFLIILVDYNTTQTFSGTGVNSTIIAMLFLLGYNPAVTTGYYTGFRDFFGLPIDPRGSVIGVSITAQVCVHIEGMVCRFMSGDLDMLLASLITLPITVTLAYLIVMPLDGWLFGDISWLFMHLNSNPLDCTVLAGLFLIAVVLGAYQGSIPVYLALIDNQGFNSLFSIPSMASTGRMGTVLALYWRARPYSALHNQVHGATIPDLPGIDKPLIYDITPPRMKPFVITCLGGAAGGSFIGLIAWQGLPMGLSNVFGPPGLVALSLIISAQGIFSTMVVYADGILVAWVSGFIFTTLLGCRNVNLDRLWNGQCSIFFCWLLAVASASQGTLF